MATASALSLSAGSYVQSYRQQQAQRSADQAFQSAQNLLSRAQDARQQAARAQQNARELEIQASQAQSEARRVSINLKAADAIQNTQTQLNNNYANLPAQVQAKADTYTAAATTTTTSVGSVVNTTA
ncbi:MAG: hypothetical protein AB1722_12055 [Pseudomonadota bacterium]